MEILCIKRIQTRPWLCNLTQKGKTQGARYIFPNLFSSIDLKYINKHVISSNIQKLLPKQQMQKSKLVLPKKMRRKFFGLLQMLTWLQKSFKNTNTTIRNIQVYKVNQIFPRQMEDFTPDLNLAIDIIEQRVILERCYVPVYYLW